MSSSSFIAPSAEAANNDQCSDNNNIFIVGEASPPIIPDLADSETQMSSQSGADTTKGSTQCRGQNQDGSQCGRPNVTTTKQWQKKPPKHDKTEVEKYHERVCIWCINKNCKESVEGNVSMERSSTSSMMLLHSKTH